MKSKYFFGVSSRLIEVGRDEEGQPVIREIFRVIAETAAGARFEHSQAFPGFAREVVSTEEGETFVLWSDKRAEATAAAERLIARINAAGGRINLDHWFEIDPVYGSAEFQSQGTEEGRWMAERMEAMGYGAAL